MPNLLQFNQTKKTHLKTLRMYVPIVARVHGASHPEFLEVENIFNQINQKLNTVRTKDPHILQELDLLKKASNNYVVPLDVCETYQAVYDMLYQLDTTYRQGLKG